jgi:tRNA 2-thiouridine synthesizing protein A
MAVIQVDARGLKCPIPTMKMNQAVMKGEAKPGDTLVVLADCPTFEKDAREWCQKTKKVLVVMRDEGGAKRCEVRI